MNPLFHVDQAMAAHLPSDKTEQCMTIILKDAKTGQEIMRNLDTTIEELRKVRKSLYKRISGQQDTSAIDIIEI